MVDSFDPGFDGSVVAESLPSRSRSSRSSWTQAEAIDGDGSWTRSKCDGDDEIPIVVTLLVSKTSAGACAEDGSTPLGLLIDGERTQLYLF